jgi:hypothetical protein
MNGKGEVVVASTKNYHFSVVLKAGNAITAILTNTETFTNK